MRQLLIAVVIALSLAGIFAAAAAQSVQHRDARGYSSGASWSFGGARLGGGLYEEPLAL
jgi:hypothetical protein